MRTKRMTFYKNILIATGTIAFVYMMLKLFTNISGKTSEKESNTKESDEIIEPQTEEKPVESAESKQKSLKRKIKENRGSMKLPKLKPNFFVALQVHDVGIHQKVKKLQEKVLDKNPALFSALVNVSTLHITLGVTHLAGEQDINVVKKKLDEWAEKDLQKYFDKPCVLSFTGVNTFNNVVAYVNIEQCENYKKISEVSKSINDVLSSAGYITDKRSFTPHLTFLKLTKNIMLLKSKKNFLADFESLKECQEHFGKQQVDQIQLLSMDEPKDKFGYYKCFHEIKIADGEKNMDHSQCCTPVVKPRTGAN